VQHGDAELVSRRRPWWINRGRSGPVARDLVLNPSLDLPACRCANHVMRPGPGGSVPSVRDSDASKSHLFHAVRWGSGKGMACPPDRLLERPKVQQSPFMAIGHLL
jgi:hypothetical protein